jgi:hypothetical protein
VRDWRNHYCVSSERCRLNVNKQKANEIVVVHLRQPIPGEDLVGAKREWPYKDTEGEVGPLPYTSDDG